MTRQQALQHLLVLGLLCLAGCGPLDGSDKVDCQLDEDCLADHYCNEEGICKEGCLVDSIRCVENSVYRCTVDHWEVWEECGENEDCVVIQGQSMCVEEDCSVDCTGKECGDNGCGGQCGVCPGDMRCTTSGYCGECDSNADCVNLYGADYYCDLTVRKCKTS
jgi:hypothetical protein